MKTNKDIHKFCDAYFRNFEKISSEDRDDFWAHQYVQHLIESDPSKAWSLILELIQLAPTKEVLAFVGADVLEDLLKSNWSCETELETKAKESKRVLYALANVWFTNPSETFEKHQALMKEYGISDESKMDLLANEIFG